jgi:colicin import membrane protein
MAAARDDLLPRPGGGMVGGAALAALAHAGLLLALTTAVQWRSSAPMAISAELWSELPQTAAPSPLPSPLPSPAPPPAPPPPRAAEPAPPDPQIAIAQARAEKARQRKEQETKARERAQADAKKREQDRLREQQAQEQRLAEQRQRNLARLMSQAGGASNGAPRAADAQTSGPSPTYPGRFVAAIKPNIVFTDAISGNPAAEVEVRAGPSGSILSRRLLRSSGNKDWDDAVLRAIDRTVALPRDLDGRVPATIIVTFKPQEE